MPETLLFSLPLARTQATPQERQALSIDARPQNAKNGWKQGKRCQERSTYDHASANPKGRQRGNVCQQQATEANDYNQAAKENGFARRYQCPGYRFNYRTPSTQLFTETAGHQQAIVDGESQANHGGNTEHLRTGTVVQSNGVDESQSDWYSHQSQEKRENGRHHCSKNDQQGNQRER